MYDNDDLLDQLHDLIGDSQSVEITTRVHTLEGLQVRLSWKRFTLTGVSGERTVLGFSLQEALRKAIHFEEEVNDAEEARQAGKLD